MQLLVEAKRRVLRTQNWPNWVLKQCGLLPWASFSSVLVVAESSRGVFPSQPLLSWGNVSLNVFWLLYAVCYCFLLLVKTNLPCSLNTKVSVLRQRTAQVCAFRRAWGVLSLLTLMNDYKSCSSLAIQAFSLLVFILSLQSFGKCFFFFLP